MIQVVSLTTTEHVLRNGTEVDIHGMMGKRRFYMNIGFYRLMTVLLMGVPYQYCIRKHVINELCYTVCKQVEGVQTGGRIRTSLLGENEAVTVFGGSSAPTVGQVDELTVMNGDNRVSVNGTCEGVDENEIETTV